MKGKAIFKTIGKLANRHGSLVLTVIAGVGVVATAILAAKARPEADERVQKAKEDKAMAEAEDKGEMPNFDAVKLTRWETIKAAAPAYVKTVVVAGLTIALIVGCHVMNVRQIGDLAAGYNVAHIINDKYSSYRNVVEDTVGPEKEAEIKAKADKQYTDSVASTLRTYDAADIETTAYMTGDGMQLFYDPYAAQFFYSSREFIKDRANELFGSNECTISYGEFREAINLPDALACNHIGWDMNVYGGRLRVEFSGEYSLSPNGLPYIVLGFSGDPVPEFKLAWR